VRDGKGGGSAQIAMQIKHAVARPRQSRRAAELAIGPVL